MRRARCCKYLIKVDQCHSVLQECRCQMVQLTCQWLQSRAQLSWVLQDSLQVSKHLQNTQQLVAKSTEFNQVMLCCAEASCSGSFSQTYTAKTGDTQMGIADTCGIAIGLIQEANPQLTILNFIPPGDSICLPTTCNLPGRRLLNLIGEW